MSLAIFTSFTLMQFISVYYIYAYKENARIKYFELFAFIVVAVEFMIFYNTIDYHYGDDLMEYKLWFENIKNIDSMDKIAFDSKGLGFSYILYFLQLYITDFDSFLLILSLYILIFLFLLVYAFRNNYKSTHSIVTVMFLFSILFLLNRYQLGFSANIIRSFLASSLFLLLVLAIIENKVFILLLPCIYFIHSLQFFLILATMIVAYFIPLRLLLWITFILLLSYFFGFLKDDLYQFLSFFVEENKVKISALLVNEYSMTINRKLQHFFYLIFPLLIILKYLYSNSHNITNKKDLFFIKTMLVSISFGVFLSDVTPRSDRILIVGLPLLYLFFIMFSSKKQQFLYINLIIILNFIAIYRNLGNFVI